MTRAYSLLEIVRQHWSKVEPLLEKRLPREVAEAARQVVPKALRCRTLEAGFVRYRCLGCHQFHTVCFRCKTRFCPSCGRARAAEAATQAQGRLLNVRHRHLTFGVPGELRALLFANRKLLAVAAKAAAYAVMRSVDSHSKKHTLLPGIMVTVHTFGSDLEFNPHVHVICTEGALGSEGIWHSITFFPAKQCRKLWQHYLLTFLRKVLCGDRAAVWRIGRLFKQYPEGFYAHVLPSYDNGVKTAAYCCRYMGRPPLSERRITHYDGQRVTYTYQDYKTKQRREITLAAGDFVLKLLQHLWPRYQRDVHYYGLYQPARRKAYVEAVVRASKYKAQNRPRTPDPRWVRLIIAQAGQEVRCPHCRCCLVVDHIEYPRKRYVPPNERPRAPTAQLPLPL